MRILFIHNFYRKAGGEDQVVAKEVELLKAHQHTVQLLAFQNDVFSKSLKGIQALFYNDVAYQRVIAEIAQFQPDVIHVHNFFYQASPAVFYAAKAKGIPTVLTLHNYRTICANALLMRNALPCEQCTQQLFPVHGIRHKCFQDSAIKTALLTATTAWHKWKGTWHKLVDRVIVLTAFAKQKFISSSLGIPEHKFIVKANSVAEQSVLPLEKRADTVVYVGRLSPEKGIEVLLEAAKHTDHTIQLIGDGPLKDMVLEAAKSCTNIQYLGQQPHKEVIRAIQGSKGLLLPSVCYEGLPNTVLEAFSTGTPVVVSDLDNLNQLVIHHKNGLTFSTGNGKALAQSIDQLLAQTDRWQELADQAYNSYQQQYTQQKNYEQLITLYQGIL